MLKGTRSADPPAEVLGDRARHLPKPQRAHLDMKAALRMGEHLYARCVGPKGSVYICVDHREVFDAISALYSISNGFKVEMWAVPHNMHQKMGNL